MKRLLNFRYSMAILSIFLIIGSANIFAQRRRPVLHRHHRAVARQPVAPAEKMYEVATGTTIRVRINKTLSSRTATVGTLFTTTVTEPVYSTTGAVVIPMGSTVVGRVDSVKSAANGGRVGQIGVTFIEVKLPNGRRRTINGSLTDVVGKDTRSDSESTVSGEPMKHRQAVFIGGGGVGGMILGGAIGGGKGALIGGILGAGAGYLGDRNTTGKEAVVTSGTDFGIYLNRPISLPKFAEVTP